jgi:hypothetical protein
MYLKIKLEVIIKGIVVLSARQVKYIIYARLCVLTEHSKWKLHHF